MGAEFDSRRYPDSLGIKKITEAWASDVETAAYEYGHGGYTGTIAEFTNSISWQRDRVFDNAEKAEEWLEDNHNKWDNAMAVLYQQNGTLMWMIGGLCSS